MNRIVFLWIFACAAILFLISANWMDALFYTLMGLSTVAYLRTMFALLRRFPPSTASMNRIAFLVFCWSATMIYLFLPEWMVLVYPVIGVWIALYLTTAFTQIRFVHRYVRPSKVEPEITPTILDTDALTEAASGSRRPR